MTRARLTRAAPVRYALMFAFCSALLMGVLLGVIYWWMSTLLVRHLDESIEAQYKSSIQDTIENDADNRISDLHIWRVGPNHYAVIVSLVTHHPQSPEYYKDLLSEFDRLSHITIEVNRCNAEPCVAPAETHN